MPDPVERLTPEQIAAYQKRARTYDDGQRLNVWAAALRYQRSIHTLKGYQRRNSWPGLAWGPMRAERRTYEEYRRGRGMSPRGEDTWTISELDEALQAPPDDDDGRFTVAGVTYYMVERTARELGVSRRTVEAMEDSDYLRDDEELFQWVKHPAPQGGEGLY